MEIKTLSEEQLRRLHETQMRAAFAPAELKPFSAMRRMMRRGEYLPLGLFDGEAIAAYALLWRAGEYMLLDYLGTEPTRRNQGLGAALMQRLPEQCGACAGIIGEVERPQPGPEEALQRRRLGFYARCGMVPAGYDCSLFGVHYQVLVLPLRPGAGDRDAVLRAHKALYRGHFSTALYRLAARIPLAHGEAPGQPMRWSEPGCGRDELCEGEEI